MSPEQAAGALMVALGGAYGLAWFAVKIGNHAADSGLARQYERADAYVRSCALALDDAWDDVAALFDGPADELAARRSQR